MSVKLIALDLDGTALLPDHLTISRRMEQALLAAYSRGIRIVPVTGRPWRLLPPFLRNHPQWESYGILCNGAEIRNLRSQEILRHLPLPEEKVKKVLNIADRYDLAVECNAGGRLFLTEKTLQKELQEPRLRFHCSVLIPETGVILPALQGFSQTVEKIHINCIPLQKIPVLMKEISQVGVSVVCEKSPNLEVTHPEADKGKGLRFLCKKLDIPMENVLALGDSGNDVTMLQEAGIAVAMATAPEKLKALADYVTGSNLEDGAAQAIEHFALQ